MTPFVDKINATIAVTLCGIFINLTWKLFGTLETFSMNKEMIRKKCGRYIRILQLYVMDKKAPHVIFQS